MKAALIILFFLVSTALSQAQTTSPARLALLAESDETRPVADLLTARLSADQNIQLLERAEIEKVYHEQELSAANKNYLKLGQILGADGLLLLGTTREGTNRFLNLRLVAVKPGVVLAAERLAWPVPDLPGWMEGWMDGWTQHLSLLLPKLTVLVKDAIPLSVVNLRSAISSAEELEAERQLKLLVIQRLSRERPFFVLERQRMESLVGEKELQLDESSFWSGAYLLEGVVDQNGYSQKIITLNARLTPPKGGAPVLIEASGSRTNLVEVINQLAAKITAALTVNASVKEWSAPDEAAQYFAEAKWALRWGVNAEAQMAADSAWALGKHDAACASLQVRACLAQADAEKVVYVRPEYFWGPSFNAGGAITHPRPDDAFIQSEIKKMQIQHPARMSYEMEGGEEAKTVRYTIADRAPNPANIDQAVRALELYADFSRTSPEGEPKAFPRRPVTGVGQDPTWYQLGLDALVTASTVLQDFYFAGDSQGPVTDKLADLRTKARLVADLISQSPTVHDSYFVGAHPVTHDTLVYTMQEWPNIFQCKLEWGCLWQETPEDCLALYRELLASPVFCYMHNGLWFHRRFPRAEAGGAGLPMEPSRLVAWRDRDRPRLGTVWGDFDRELAASTKVLWQLEAKAARFADVVDQKKLGDTFTDLLDAFVDNRCAMRANNVELLYMDWGMDRLIETKTSGIGSEFKSKVRERFHSEYLPKLAAKDLECGRLVADGKNTLEFEKQKQFLRNNAPLDDPQTLNNLFVFGFKDYSKAQALELEPLLAAYRTNLAAHVHDSRWATIGLLQLGQIDAKLVKILNSTAPPSLPAAQIQIPTPPVMPRPPVMAPSSPRSLEIPTNVLTVQGFLEIPLEGLHSNQVSGAQITAHHWVEEKLVLDLKYTAPVYSMDSAGNWLATRYANYPAIAVLDPKTKHWDVVSGSEVDMQERSPFYYRSTLWRGNLFTCDGGQLSKYDFKTKEWRVLEISHGGNDELFNVNDHLYGANASEVFEILDDEKGTRLLASTRRQPPVSVLDGMDLGIPTLFEGPAHSLRINAAEKIFTWMGHDWREDADAPYGPPPPVLLADGLLFAGPGHIARLATDGNAPELYIGQTPRIANPANLGRPGAITRPPQKPKWKLPPGFSVDHLAAASSRSNLYLLLDHSVSQSVVNDQNPLLPGRKIVAQDGYHAELLCFSSNTASPQELFLKFDDADVSPPLIGRVPGRLANLGMGTRTWIFCAADTLFVGLENPLTMIPTGSSSTGKSPKTGIWFMPFAELDAAQAAQKIVQRAQNSQVLAAAERIHQILLARYDHNQNGMIDPPEKVEALDDPLFIEAELEVLDANQNGWLDPEELAYFDVNTNKVLEAKEQAGIEIAQHLLAERLFKTFDANRDGFLDAAELNELKQSGLGATARALPGLPPPVLDAQHTGHVDLEQLEAYLRQRLLWQLRSSQGGKPEAPMPMRLDINQADGYRAALKAALEAYWRDPGGRGPGPQIFRGNLPGRAGAAPGLPNGPHP